MIVPLGYVLILSTLLFALGLFAALARRNLIMMLLGIEIMLNAGALAFVGAALRWGQLEGQAVVIFILAIAATEVAVGLGAIIGYYRYAGSIDPAMDVAIIEEGGAG